VGVLKAMWYAVPGTRYPVRGTRYAVLGTDLIKGLK
jgi:hypothetical protein